MGEFFCLPHIFRLKAATADVSLPSAHYSFIYEQLSCLQFRNATRSAQRLITESLPRSYIDPADSQIGYRPGNMERALYCPDQAKL